MNSLVLCGTAMFLLLGLAKGGRSRWNYPLRLSNMTVEEGQFTTWAKENDWVWMQQLLHTCLSSSPPHHLTPSYLPIPHLTTPLQYHKFNQIKCSVRIFISFDSQYTLFILKCFTTQSPSGYKGMPFVFAVSVKIHPTYFTRDEGVPWRYVCKKKTIVSLYLYRILILLSACVYSSNIFVMSSLNWYWGGDPCRDY